LREQVLRLGRNYAAACDQCGVKVFDETALALDVEAACGPEETAPAAPDPGPAGPGTHHPAEAAEKRAFE
jgi:hypothetical protein